MSYIYNTRLVCKSNKKLLQKIDPSKIIIDRCSEFLSCDNGAYNFITRNGTMHSSIVALSNDYPTEVFIAQFFSVEIYDSVIESYKYVNGFSKFVKTEPNYMYCVSHLEEIMGKKTVKKFMRVALRQIKRIDSINDIPTTKKNSLERKHKISSSITINVEDDDFKIEVTKIGYSYIEVRGFVKEAPTSRWQLIEKEKNKIVKVSHQMEEGAEKTKDEKYKDVPF